MNPFHKVAHLSEIPVGQSKLIELSGKIIAVFHTEVGLFAIDERCPHRGGPLSEGDCKSAIVTCPWHQARFDLKTGKCKSSTSISPVKTYPIRIRGSEIEVEI